ncbi:MAG TPA: DUF4339 domain-containing protein [Verrucomicrobiae bacterium]|jgi:hypothetical protein|nr:DUF4339 domain-containing protein [Verrucomicrobiae bacterium]
MYKIIGANQVEYGPVTAEQLRQWISEGRVNAQTQAQAIGETNWRPISTFPEFATSFPGNATPPPLSSSPPVPPLSTPPSPPSFGAGLPNDAGRAVALSEVSGPAIGLMVTAILGAFAALCRIFANAVGFPMNGFNNFNNFNNMPPEAQQWMRMMQSTSGTVGIFFSILGIAIAIFIFFGALKMKKLENHTFCVIASIIAMIPCISPCCCVGLPLGIWALVVLNKSEVRAYFS